jgi:hypothetical protein
MCIGKSSFTTTTQYTHPTFIHIFKWWGYRGQVVGKIPRPSGGDIEVNWWGNSKAKWWGYRGQVVGKIIKVKWWGYPGQVVGISRSSGGDIKVRGRGLEVKVKKKWWGSVPSPTPSTVDIRVSTFAILFKFS